MTQGVEIQSCWLDSFDSFKRFLETILFSRYKCDQRIRDYFNEMHYINLRFTYSLTYLLIGLKVYD